MVGIGGGPARRCRLCDAFQICVAERDDLDDGGAPVRLQMEAPDAADADEADAQTILEAAQKFTLASIPIERGVLM